MVENVEIEERGIDYVALFAVSILCVCLSMTFLFLKMALKDFTPIEAAAGRMVVASLFLIPFTIVTGVRIPTEKWFWKWSTILAVISFLLPGFLIAYAQRSLPTNVTSIYFASMPLLILFFSWLILRTEVTARKLIGLGIGVAGLIILADPLGGPVGTASGGLIFHAATLASVVSYALAGVLMRVMPKAHPVAVIGAAAGIAGLIGLPIIGTYFMHSTPSWTAVIGVTGTGLFSTAIAFTLRFFLIRRKGPVYLAPNAIVSAILSVAIGIVVLGEAVTMAIVIALPLVIVGLIVAQDGSGKMDQA